MIDGWKNRGLTPEDVPAARRAFANGRGKKLYAAYQERLKTLNAADFGDLLLEPSAVPREPGRARRLSRALPLHAGRRVPGHQRRAVSVAAAARAGLSRRNICCVGDDDQSIYGWRGAEVDNILRFEKDFPGAKVIRLERNYRSTGHILAAASHLIAHNEGRLGKTLFTEDDAGREGHRHRRLGFRGGGARRSARRSSSCSARATSSNEIAILVRASFQMREFEDRFVTLGLPYRVIGGPRFYERRKSATRSPICASSPAGRRPRLRAHRQRAQARPRRRDGEIAARLRARARRPLLAGRARAWSRPTN
jgi:DNA helicase II / ATP-dependent DNA helicase PcrA